MEYDFMVWYHEGLLWFKILNGLWFNITIICSTSTKFKLTTFNLMIFVIYIVPIPWFQQSLASRRNTGWVQFGANASALALQVVYHDYSHSALGIDITFTRRGSPSRQITAGNWILGNDRRCHDYVGMDIFIIIIDL